MRDFGLRRTRTTMSYERHHWVTNIIKMPLAFYSQILVIVFSAANHAYAAAASAHSQQSVQAKIEYCKTCHGLSGQGYRGFFPMPRLAGQQTEYFENQLRAFDERRRENQYMYGVSHNLSQAMRAALATYFSELNPSPLRGASRSLVAAGGKIYEEGIPASNVPACMACHGPEAKGRAEIPRLAGQLHDYIYNKLVNWTKERGQNAAKPDTSAIMAATSHSLTKSETKAIAAYLSYLQ